MKDTTARFFPDDFNSYLRLSLSLLDLERFYFIYITNGIKKHLKRIQAKLKFGNMDSANELVLFTAY